MNKSAFISGYLCKLAYATGMPKPEDDAPDQEDKPNGLGLTKQPPLGNTLEKAHAGLAPRYAAHQKAITADQKQQAPPVSMEQPDAKSAMAGKKSMTGLTPVQQVQWGLEQGKEDAQQGRAIRAQQSEERKERAAGTWTHLKGYTPSTHLRTPFTNTQTAKNDYGMAGIHAAGAAIQAGKRKNRTVNVAGLSYLQNLGGLSGTNQPFSASKPGEKKMRESWAQSNVDNAKAHLQTLR
jgi:hypothetical protein